MTTSERGDRRPSSSRSTDGRGQLDRPPGDRYRAAPDAGDDTGDRVVWPALAVGLGAVIGYVLLGGVLAVTAGLIVVAGFAGWLLGKLVAGPRRAAAAGVATVVVGLLGVWLFGRIEGGVLDPITYLDEVQGWPLVVLQLVAGGGLAAASSR